MIIDRLNNDGIPELKLNDIQIQARSEVHQALEDGEYLLEEVTCAVCGSTESTNLGEKDRYGLYYPTVICKECGLIYSNPRMTQESYNTFYNREYRRLYNGAETATELFFHRQQKQGQRIYDYLKSKNLLPPEGAKIIEVGCGAGGILKFFKSKGYEILGLDLGEEYINYGREHHQLDLRSGFLADLDDSINADLIIYSHVLEHILDPVSELEEVKKYLNTDGRVYIEVPGIKNIHKNYDSNILTYLQNAHTFHFSLESLKNLLSKCSFKLIVGDQYVHSVFGVNENGNQQGMVNDRDAVISYIEQTEINRLKKDFSFEGMKKSLHQATLTMLDKTGTRGTIKGLRRMLGI